METTHPIYQSNESSLDELYAKLVNTNVRRRLRFVGIFCGVLFMSFYFLDRAVYADYVDAFFPVRLTASILIFLCGVAGFLLPRKTPFLWFGDLAVISGGMAINCFIYLSDGVKSEYYEGLNLCFLALICLNIYKASHVFWGCSLCLIGYFVAIYLNPTPVTIEQVAPQIFFLGSTLAFVTILATYYSKQHYNEFIKTHQLEVAAKNLDDANQKLLATEKLKSEFFANVSHELRTPLTLILGPVRKHLSVKNVPEHVRKDLGIVERNAILLLKHVNDLLDISKLDAGRMNVDYTELDLAKLIRLIASHFEVVARDRGMKFVVKAPGMMIAHVDQKKMERIVFNLLSNAFKFTPDGGIVQCGIRIVANDIEIEVADSGPGIPVNQRNMIFERFKQGETGDTRRYGGTGLGLAISREYVELQNGSIEVMDSPSGGALFVVRLPRFVSGNLNIDRNGKFQRDAYKEFANQALSISLEERAPAANLPEVSLNAQTILVVEDSHEMNNFIAEALASDYKIIQAFDGDQGLRFAVENKPDLIITDIMMPGLSGEQLVRAMRAQPENNNIPIVVLSAKSDPTLSERLLLQGVQDYLTKPFTVGELKARVANLVSMKKIRDVLESELTVHSESLLDMTVTLAESKRQKEQALLASEELSRTRQEFITNLSHELRTPLTSILGWTELIANGDLSKNEMSIGLDTIERNAKLQLRLVNDLLDISKLVQGKFELRMAQFDFSQVIGNSVQSVIIAARAKGIRLESQIPSQSLPVLGDCDRLHQAVWNLLINAVKFTPAGGHVNIQVENSNREAYLCIMDSGQGIDQQILPHIFEPLKQADGSLTRQHGGLGLGLAITRHLVELHGGTIDAYSEGVGRGSRFTVTLPLSVENHV